MSTKEIVARLDELLKPLGFARKKLTWNRRSGDFIDVLDVQSSKAGDTVTVNAGVTHADIHLKCWGTALPSWVQEPDCIVRTRVGELVDGKDLWWSLNETSAVGDAAEKTASRLLPFITQMHSVGAMASLLEARQVARQKYPPPIIYLALLKDAQGDTAAAHALLNDLASRPIGAWKTKLEAVASRLGRAATTPDSPPSTPRG